MTGSPVSIGDVLMISQIAWKVARAFTAGRSGAPHEFAEIESELKSLTTALDQLAEALEEDAGLLAAANDKTKAGVSKVLICCRQTLQDLDSFVLRYQVIQKPDPGAGPVEQTSERRWKTMLLRNWRTLWWTTEGGSIQTLREILQMHVSSIALTMQALQSKSLARLERTLAPMAVQVEEVHDLMVGKMNTKIDDLHHLMLCMANQRPGPPPTPPGAQAPQPSAPLAEAITNEEQHASSNSEQSQVQKFELPPASRQDMPNSPSQTSSQPTPDLVDSQWHPDGYPSPMTASSISSPYRNASHLSPQLLQTNGKPRQMSFPVDLSASPADTSLVPLGAEADLARWRSDSHTQYMGPWPLPGRGYGSLSSHGSAGITAVTMTPHTLPPPAMPAPLKPCPPVPQRPSTKPDRQQGEASAPQLGEAPAPQQRPSADAVYAHFPPPEQPLPQLARSETTASQHEAFERALWRNAVTLCEVKAKLVEYTRWSPECHDFEMVTAAPPCQVYLVQRHDQQSNGEIRYSSSIWALSHNRQVRMQHKLNEGEHVVPYTVWGAECKVTLRNKCSLKFHDIIYGAKPTSVVETSWVNYIFEDELASGMFQSALMGMTLLASIKTRKTLRVHEGLTGSFAYQEQMCALENLRIWQDPETNGVVAMIHFTPQFKDGYLAFYLNSRRDPIRVKDEDGRWVRIKGLNIFLDRKNSGAHNAAATVPDGGASSAAASAYGDGASIALGASSRHKFVAGIELATAGRSSSVASGASGGSGGSSSVASTSGGRRKRGKKLPSSASAATSPSSASRSGSGKSKGKGEKRITAARIEFSSVAEKELFLTKYRDSQSLSFLG